MLLKITEKCSAGCIHCMNDAKPTGRHMTKGCLRDALTFICKNDICRSVIVTGGEPTEHPDFLEFADAIIDRILQLDRPRAITFTSNGFWVLDHPEEARSLVERSTKNCLVQWQISTDSRYYVKKLDTTKRIWREGGFTLCENCVQKMDLMGRAKENNLAPDTRKQCSSCCNLRLVTRQLYDRDNNTTLKDVLKYMESIGRMCTPAIKIDGGIGMGESDLCPSVADIYMFPEQIMNAFLNCSCRMCGNNDNLSPEIKRMINN